MTTKEEQAAAMDAARKAQADAASKIQSARAPESKLSDEEKAAGVSPHSAAAAAPARPDKAERTRAEKAREKAMASERFITHHAVGEHAAGAIVERTKFGRFVNDKGEPDQEAYDANIGRLLDLGAIGPAPEEEKD